MLFWPCRSMGYQSHESAHCRLKPIFFCFSAFFGGGKPEQWFGTAVPTENRRCRLCWISKRLAKPGKVNTFGSGTLDAAGSPAKLNADLERPEIFSIPIEIPPRLKNRDACSGALFRRPQRPQVRIHREPPEIFIKLERKNWKTVFLGNHTANY